MGEVQSSTEGSLGEGTLSGRMRGQKPRGWSAALAVRTLLPAVAVVFGCGCVRVPAAEEVPSPSRLFPPDDSVSFRKALLDAHNRWREDVGVSPLSWSEEAARQAQSWAERLASRGCAMEHSQSRDFGENIAWGNTPGSPELVVELWAQERDDYDYATNTCTPGKMCGHYTQLVWRDTREVGCAVAACEGGEVWVCNYTPPGNWIGEKPY